MDRKILTACPPAVHAAMKATPEAWEAGTKELPHTGERTLISSGNEVHEYGLCRVCSTTVVRVVWVGDGCRGCGEEVDDGEEFCSRNCMWSVDGPPDSYWEDQAESADRAAVREAAMLKDAGR